MDCVCLNRAAAVVRPQAFGDASSGSLASRCATAEVAHFQFHLPGNKSNRSTRRRPSDAPSGQKFRPRLSPCSVVAFAESPPDSDSEPIFRSGKGSSRAAEIVTGGRLSTESNAFAKLENAYRQSSSFETLKTEFEAKLDSMMENEDMWDINGQVAYLELDGVRRTSSTTPPKVVKKRTGRRGIGEGNRLVRIAQNPGIRMPRKVAVVTPTEPEIVDRGGKRRLSLSSRIAMKQNKQEGLNAENSSTIVETLNMSPEDQDLWSQAASDLIKNYSSSLDLTGPLWDKLGRGLLTAGEEHRLAILMKPFKKLDKAQKILVQQIGKEPTDEEWAAAAGVELSTLRRRLALGRAARTKLIQSNLRLVVSQAYKYHKDKLSLSIQDLCQEGVVGLMHAVDKFDPGKGYRFSTYGIYWIKNSILRAQTKSGHMIRSPHNVATHKVSIKRAHAELTTELGRPPTDEEIRKHVGITADRFRDIVRADMRTSSMHELDRVTGRERVENLVSEEFDALSAFTSNTSVVQHGLDDVLDSLRPKENLVLRQRFGLDGKGQRSLSEVGLTLNMSREMVRRYELRGILKLKHPTRVEYLKNYLN